MCRAKYRYWTEKEINILTENWGRYSKAVLCQKLNRTVYAIHKKALQLGLGPQVLSSDKITSRALGEALGVNPKTVKIWTDKRGLRFYSFKLESKVYKMINIEDFWIWAENNQCRFDASKLEPLMLGVEPEWLKLKRKADFKDKIERQKNNSKNAKKDIYKKIYLCYNVINKG